MLLLIFGYGMHYNSLIYNIHDSSKVVVDRIGVRVHICADTAHALTSFISDITSVFAPPGDPYVHTPFKLCTKFIPWTATRNLK